MKTGYPSNEAIQLARALTSREFKRRIKTDLTCRYTAPEWVYLVQGASLALVSIATNFLSDYIYDRAKKASEPAEPEITDIYTREILEGVATYRRAVEALRKYRTQDKKDRKTIDLYILDCDRVTKLLEGETVDGINLFELLATYKSDKKRK